MNRILCSDWLPERARRSYLARSGLPAAGVSCKKIVFFSHILNPLLTGLFGQDGWGLASFSFSLVCGARLRSVRKHNNPYIYPNVARCDLLNLQTEIAFLQPPCSGPVFESQPRSQGLLSTVFEQLLCQMTSCFDIP